MALAKLHPALGWLYLSGQEYRICFNKLIQMRDEQIKAGTYTSGLPEGYLSWSLENLKELAKQPQYKKRIEEHLTQLILFWFSSFPILRRGMYFAILFLGWK